MLPTLATLVVLMRFLSPTYPIVLEGILLYGFVLITAIELSVVSNVCDAVNALHGICQPEPVLLG